MSNLFPEESPSKRLEADEPERMENLSPAKYGKAAYVGLTFTPSKLKESVLYRETNTLKRVQESNSKVRDLESQNVMLEDKVNKITEERNGIESSLNSQIQMYKKLLADSESKYEVRIKNHQTQFRQKMDELLLMKEEEAKFAQSEKEILENEIERLRKIIEDLEQKLAHSGDKSSGLEADNEKLNVQNKNLEEKLEKLSAQKSENERKAQQNYEKLSRQKFESETLLKQQADEKLLQKEREIDSIKRQHHEDVSKIESQRAQDNLLKNEQVNNITKAFESETERLNNKIDEKEESINKLNDQLNEQREKVANLTKNYEAEINTLVHEKNRYFSELQISHKQNQSLTLRISDNSSFFESQKSSLHAQINELRQTLDLSNMNLIKQKDYNRVMNDDLQRELILVKEQRIRMNRVSDENVILGREVRNLKDLLMESSSELEKCKDQFIKMGRERDILLLKLRELGHENDALHQIKSQREKEGRQWRDAYYRSRVTY